MKLADRYPTRFLREYVKWKVRMDPIYESVLQRLPSVAAPLIDLGCGVGILALVLREKGFRGPITGIDHDAQKIAVARSVTADIAEVDFIAGDARDPLPRSANVVLFDVLHYFSDGEQKQILGNVAAALPPRGVAIIRDGIREPDLRYWITYLGEVFARINGWLKAERLNFPRSELFEQAFPAPAFSVVSERLSGVLPTNNFLFVVTRES